MSITCPNSNWALNSGGTACVPTAAKVTCGSSTITIEVHVDHLYADLDSAYYADALAEFGTCVGTAAPDATTGVITDTFNIEACGGTWTQSGNIVVDFEVKGNNAAISTDVGGVTIITTSVLSFDAHCEYSSTASLTTSHSVDSDSVTADEIQDTTGDFTDQFSLDWFSADTRLSSDKTTPTLGDTVYLQTTSTLALSHEFYLSSCTASKGGQSIALVDNCSQDQQIVTALGLVNPGMSKTNLDWSFTAFAIDGQDPALDIACDVGICVKDSSDNYLDSNCGAC